MKSLETNRGIDTVLVYVALEAGTLLMTLLFIWMVFTSFKSAGESVQIPSTIPPKQRVKENYLRAIAPLPIMKPYVNTALLILFRVLCAVALSPAAGLASAKPKFKGKNFLFPLVVVQMMPPSQIFIIPQYQMLARIGLTNSMFTLVFPGPVSAFGAFFLRRAYMGTPDELGEAAYLDSCTRWQTFTKIMMPLTKVSMAALTISTAVSAYADLMWPLITNTDLSMMTLPVGLSTPRGQFITNYPVLMVGSVLAMVPMVILYLAFQKQFIEGIAMTGGKWKMEIKTEVETDRDRYI